MRHKLYVVGVGPGAPEQLTPAARAVISRVGTVMAAPRLRPLTQACARFIAMGAFDAAFAQLDSALDEGDAAVLVSGDTGIFSLLPLLKKRFSPENIAVIPGISSLQMLCARCAQTWVDAAVLSGHGRALSEAKLLDTVDQNAKTIFFCGPEWKPERVCRVFRDAGMNGLSVTAGERLSYPDERVVRGAPGELASGSFDALALVLIENPRPWTPPRARPRDEDFVRGKTPMTRAAVRSAILDALRLGRDAVLWDLGAGTGSVTVAAALECADGSVFAVERDAEAAALVRANCARFHRHNVTVVEADNLAALPSLPHPTHVFVGGCGAQLVPVLERLAALGGGIRVVVSAVALKTWADGARVLGGPLFHDFDAVQIAVSRLKTVGATAIMAAQNPVTVFSAVTGPRKEGE